MIGAKSILKKLLIMEADEMTIIETELCIILALSILSLIVILITIIYNSIELYKWNNKWNKNYKKKYESGGE